MIINTYFKKKGEPTSAGCPVYMAKMRDRLKIFQHTSADEMNQRIVAQYLLTDRYEYVVTNDEGETLATMVVAADDCDIHIGKPVLFPLIAGSLEPGLLTGAYKWLKRIAKDEGIEFILISKTEGYTVRNKYHKII